MTKNDYPEVDSFHTYIHAGVAPHIIGSLVLPDRINFMSGAVAGMKLAEIALVEAKSRHCNQAAVKLVRVRQTLEHEASDLERHVNAISEATQDIFRCKIKESGSLYLLLERENLPVPDHEEELIRTGRLNVGRKVIMTEPIIILPNPFSIYQEDYERNLTNIANSTRPIEYFLRLSRERVEEIVDEIGEHIVSIDPDLADKSFNMTESILTTGNSVDREATAILDFVHECC